MSDKLTLTLGLRFDYQSARTEVNNQYSTFDPNTPNPGAGGYSRRDHLRGRRSGTGRDADVREPAEGRVGAARRVRLSDQRQGRAPRRLRHLLRARRVRSVRRAADARIPGEPARAEHRPTACQPAFYLDNGFPQIAIQSAAVHRPDVRPSGGAHRGGAGRADAAAVPELVGHLPAPATSNMMLDVSYIGNHGSRLNHHFADAGRRREHERPERAGAGSPRAAVGHQLGCWHAAPAFTSPYAGFSGNVAQALRKYPQYQHIIWRGVPTGESQYHALEAGARAPLLAGTPVRASGTPTRTCTTTARRARRATTASTAACRTRRNPLQWALSADDTPHVFLTGFTWEVPGPKEQAGRRRRCSAAGTSAGILRYESGRPLNITMNNDLGGLLFNGQKRPNRTSGADGVLAAATSIPPPTATSTGRMDGSRAAAVRQRAASATGRCAASRTTART